MQSKYAKEHYYAEKNRLPNDIDAVQLARNSPAGFAWHVSDGRWIPADHLLALSEKIVAVATGRISRLAVFMPPRHGKSELISRYTPAWYLGRFPDRKVMLASYADTFAASWGRLARDTFRENAWRVFRQRLDDETAGGQQWQVRGREGVMVTAGVGGGMTGKGAHLLIIDDPIKNADEAHSATTREKHHDWWKSTARTRLQKDAGVILVMTRWHEDDLAGRLIRDWLEGEGDEWEILSLAGFAEQTASASYPSSRILELGADPLGREVGAPLWPDMFDSENLAQTRRAMGSYWFNAMYQQRPSPAEGALFKRADFRYFERTAAASPDTGHPHPIVTIFRDSGAQVFDVGYGIKFQTVDCASSEKESADYTVISTWIVTPQRDLLLWDRVRVQFSGPNVRGLIRRTFFEHRPGFVGVESERLGDAIIAELVMEGLPLVPLRPDRDKVSRALPAVARYEEHRVFHPLASSAGDGWVAEEWEPELLSFPNAANDDQVDTVAYAALQLPFLSTAMGVRSDALGPRHDGQAQDGHMPEPPAGPTLDGEPEGMLTGGLMGMML
jgi:predicted phage terminase large subunit-like protein